MTDAPRSVGAIEEVSSELSKNEIILVLYAGIVVQIQRMSTKKWFNKGGRGITGPRYVIAFRAHLELES